MISSKKRFTKICNSNDFCRIPEVVTPSNGPRTAGLVKLPNLARSAGIEVEEAAVVLKEAKVSNSCTSSHPIHPAIVPAETGQSFRSRVQRSPGRQARTGFRGKAARTTRQHLPQEGSNNNNNTRGTTASRTGPTARVRVGRVRRVTTSDEAERRSSKRRHCRDDFITPTASTGTR